MKTIILNRHGKSDWSESDQEDYNRTLAKRGVKDSNMMAELLKSKNIKINKIISSSACRAISTAKIFKKTLSIVDEHIQEEIDIYSSGVSYFKNKAINWSNELNTVLVFGHNPDFSSIATYYLGYRFANIPTCGMVCLDFEINSWEELNSTNATLRFFQYPKMFRKDADID